MTAFPRTIAVVGLGYVGLPLAVEFGKRQPTIGFDLSQKKIDAYGRGIDPTGFDLDALALAAEGYAGAEIEQAVVAAIYSSKAAEGTPSTGHVLAAIAATRPLSVVMAERIAALRLWAAERTVPAD